MRTRFRKQHARTAKSTLTTLNTRVVKSQPPKTPFGERSFIGMHSLQGTVNSPFAELSVQTSMSKFHAATISGESRGSLDKDNRTLGRTVSSSSFETALSPCPSQSSVGKRMAVHLSERNSEPPSPVSPISVGTRPMDSNGKRHVPEWMAGDSSPKLFSPVRKLTNEGTRLEGTFLLSMKSGGPPTRSQLDPYLLGGSSSLSSTGKPMSSAGAAITTGNRPKSAPFPMRHTQEHQTRNERLSASTRLSTD